jgi:pSer/pThr/pTyr-binding forkhead associated (FHA) protein
MSLAVVELHPTPGLARSLEGGATIGRGDDCDIRLDDPMVSRHHAVVGGDRAAPAIEDLGSANGLYVNGRRRDGSVRLRAGDIVQLGATIWLVVPA